MRRLGSVSIWNFDVIAIDLETILLLTSGIITMESTVLVLKSL